MATREQTDDDTREMVDNWWWLVVRNPNREIHLYELGLAQAGDDGAQVPLPDDRRAVIMTELGAPDGAGPAGGWDMSMAPGRPNAYLEPKEYDLNGDLLPIRARAGVTLHLLPASEPGTPVPQDEA